MHGHMNVKNWQGYFCAVLGACCILQDEDKNSIELAVDGNHLSQPC